jgi:colanic acid biosynthesis glycosyl transferase WcaI
VKILLYGINFAPELTGIGKYTGEMAVWLAAAGHDVRVVTAPPYYPEWQIRDGYLPMRQQRELWHGVEVWRAPLWVPARPSGLKRLLHLASFALGSMPPMLAQLRWSPDVVWVVEPPLFCAPVGLLIARLTGARAWLHIQDYEVDAAFALGLLRGALTRRLVLSLERWLMRRFDRVSTISSSMMVRAAAKGIDAARLVYFPNWINLDTIRLMTKPSSYRAQLDVPPNAVVALYSGNMGGKQGLEIMAQAAKLLTHEKNLYFVFCGNGAGKADLLKLTEGLPNVQFLNLQPMERLNELLALADIHLLPQRADAEDLVMPSKLTGMLASGRPVVATANPDSEVGKVLEHCGHAVRPEDALSFAIAIRDLARDPAKRKELGLVGRKYAETQLCMTNILRAFDQSLADAHTASTALGGA